MLSLVTRVQSYLVSRRSDDTGATAVEYGMIVALIAAVIVATVAGLGTKINTAFNTVSSKL